MRLRKKKNLDLRMLAVKDLIVASQYNGFYDLPVDERKNVLDFKKIFQNSNDIVLDVGCGRGGFACEFAKQNKNLNLLAVEKLSNVIVEACEKAQQLQLPNLRFVNCGAENLLFFLPKKSVSKIYLNFSCPFPKKAYANRRLTSQNYLNVYKELLIQGGQIFQKTDNRQFFLYSLTQYKQFGFETEEFLDPQEYSNGVMTEYEKKFVSQEFPIFSVKAFLKKC